MTDLNEIENELIHQIYFQWDSSIPIIVKSVVESNQVIIIATDQKDLWQNKLIENELSENQVKYNPFIKNTDVKKICDTLRPRIENKQEKTKYSQELKESNINLSILSDMEFFDFNQSFELKKYTNSDLKDKIQHNFINITNILLQNYKNNDKLIKEKQSNMFKKVMNTYISGSEKEMFIKEYDLKRHLKYSINFDVSLDELDKTIIKTIEPKIEFSNDVKLNMEINEDNTEQNTKTDYKLNQISQINNTQFKTSVPVKNEGSNISAIPKPQVNSALKRNRLNLNEELSKFNTPMTNVENSIVNNNVLNNDNASNMNLNSSKPKKMKKQFK